MKSQTMKSVIRTVSGYPLTLTDCAEGNLLDYVIYGNNNGVGDNTINLCDISNWNFIASASNYIKSVDGKLYVRGGPVNINSSINIVQFFKSLKPNTTYTLLCDVPSGATGISQIRAFVNDTIVFRIYPASGVGVFTTPNQETLDGITKMYIYGGYTDADYVENFMVVEGSYTSSTRPEYEPYGYKIPLIVTNNGTSTTINIYLDEPLEITDSIDYSESGTDVPISAGTNVITVGTSVEPSNMKATYRLEG